MSEIQVVIAVLVTLAAAYLFIYPRFANDDVKKLAWLDMGVGAILLGILAPFYWNSPKDFSFFAFETNWWIFTIIVYAVLEIPLFFLYVKARGLGPQYREAFKANLSLTQMASVKSVEKQLADTRWDGLRTPEALRFLVIGANLVTVVGTIFLFLVGDNKWSSLLFVYVILLFLFWFLLRQAVRLIPEAPDAALDERMIQERNSTYFRAYQILFGVSSALAGALLGYAISMDIFEDSEGFNGFNYQFELTWPQINAIFWLIFGYAHMLPSMVMAWREYKRLTRHGLSA